ncbi:MFS transporter [Massilia sp. G4R7]|uniref:MFS transporter n=1 Tax=Massilia phyllostachyos TaxID=2898585 RepID=A0ABS8Q9G4_9BURK|nr:MFS transporter [Massilia phyllostachyos]MCD2518398.1 MFS transporter [Massilia phyllostachyos]
MAEGEAGVIAPGARRAPGALAAAGFPLLLCFLLVGDLAWSLKERAMPDLFKTQLLAVSQDALLPNILFGALPALIAMVFGPLLGTWSDRTRTRIGRRIPFLLVCTPMISASIVGLAYSDAAAGLLWRWSGAGPASRQAFLVGWMCLCWTVYELFTVLANALFTALINDTVPHRILGRFFGLFRIVSLGVGVAFFYLVFNDELPALARTVLLVIAAAYMAGFMVLCAGVREPRYPPHQPAPAPGLRGLRRGTDQVDRFHGLLFLALAIGTVCVLPVNINSYAALAQFGVDRTSYGQAVAIAYSISILMALPLGWLADRIHPLRVGYAVLGLYAVCMLGAFALVDGRLSFLLWFVVHSVLAGAFLTGTAALLPALLPKAHFSALAAFSSSVTALLTVVCTVAVGGLLDWNGGDFRVIFLASGAAAACGVTCWYVLLRAYARAGCEKPGARS